MNEWPTDVDALLTQARDLRKESYEPMSALQAACHSGNLEPYIRLKLRRVALEQQAQTIEERVIMRQATQLLQNPPRGRLLMKGKG
jgi:hypothetical protein